MKRFIALVCGFVALASSAYSAISFVQVGHWNGSAVVFAGAQTAGDTNFIYVTVTGTASAPTSVSDAINGAYTLVGNSTANTSDTVYLYARFNIAAASAGANTISVGAPSGGNISWSCAEYSGIAPILDGSVQTGSGTGTAISTGPLTTTNANDLILVVAGDANSGDITAGSGYTRRIVNTGQTNNFALEDQIVSSTGTFTGPMTGAASAAWSDLTVAFKASAAQSPVTGQWATLPYLMPINPIRLDLLRNGKVLIVAGSENDPNKHSQGSSKAAVWDLAAQAIPAQQMLWDVFCNGGTFLDDGRCMVVGGTAEYDPFYGEPRLTVFDPLTNKFNQLHSMAHGRWYATAITLGDGRILTFSGLNETGATNQTVEVYKVAPDTVGPAGWSPPYDAGFSPPLYPWLHLLPNGTIFYSGGSANSKFFDLSVAEQHPTTPGAGWTSGPTTFYGLDRTYGYSVLLPLLPSNNYAPRVMILGGGTNGATATTEIVDLSQTTPAWAFSGNMPSGARVQGNAVLLPNGQVLALGGSVRDEDVNSATLGADLYDPATGLWSSAGICSYARLYHSSAILLPDATVVSVGSNPQRGTYEQHIEVYSPAYLFNADGTWATRPVIQSTPASIGYGSGTFQVQTPDALNINSVVLARPGSDTHAFNMEQRLVGLAFTSSSGVLTVNLPPNSNVAPPGYYMLFILNSAGVPSMASFVQVINNPTDQPPKGTITAPTGGMTITAGQSVNFGATAYDLDGSVSGYSWYFPAGIPTTSTVLNPGVVTFPTAGTSVGSLTVVDNLGINDPSPPTQTITVQPAVQITNPPAGSTVNGTVSINANVTGTVGNSNTFTFMADSTVLSTQTTTGTSASTNWNTGQQSGGTHTLTVSVTDADIFDPNAATGSTSEQVTVGGITTYSISGTITNGAGAAVALSGTSSGSTTADSSGNYTLSGLSNGTYTVTPTLSGYTFSPANQSVTVSGANVTGVNFTGSLIGGGNIAFVQSNNVFRGSSTSSLSAAYNSKAQTAGNTNIVVVYATNNAPGTAPSISRVYDNINGNYTFVGQAAGADVSAYIYRFSNIKSASAGADRVNVIMAAAVPALGIEVFEYSGLLITSSPLDGMVQQSHGNSANASIPPVTTSNAKDLIFAVAVGDNNKRFTAGPGYTLRASYGNRPCVGVEDRITSSAGSYSASFTNATQNWAGLSAAFFNIH
jgi:hypothetical protein